VVAVMVVLVVTVIVIVVIVVVLIVFIVVTVVILVVHVVLVIVRGRWGKVMTLAMWKKKVVTSGNGPMAPSVVLVALGEIGKCQ
jgi:hypothetical protein